MADAGTADPGLVAAVTVAAYRSVCVTSVSRQLAGESYAEVVEDHRSGWGRRSMRWERMFPGL